MAIGEPTRVERAKLASGNQEMKRRHFVLVHGMGQGAWCWHRVKPRLEAAGHRVTALDLAASGASTKSVEELRSFKDYNEPLAAFMASLAAEERVVLVGHSLGGLNIAFAMEEFPEKVSAAAFVAAIVPDTVRDLGHFVKEAFSMIPDWMDCQFSTRGDPNDPLEVVTFGPEFISLLCSNSPPEGLELARTSVRPMVNFAGVLATAKRLSEDRYGSVRRVFVILKDDKALPEEFQRKMIEGSGVNEVKEIDGADHMGMLSRPLELSDCLLQIADGDRSE